MKWGKQKSTLTTRCRVNCFYNNSTVNSRKLTSFIIIVPSIPSSKSFKVFLTNDITLCILSISCLKNMFIEFRGSIFFNLKNKQDCKNQINKLTILMLCLSVAHRVASQPYCVWRLSGSSADGKHWDFGPLFLYYSVSLPTLMLHNRTSMPLA